MCHTDIYDSKEEVRDNEIYTQLCTEPAERERDKTRFRK